MGFFSRKQKQIALSTPKESLEKAYHISEQNLKKAAMTGNEKQLRTAMKQHGNFEYAMLYKNTPEYNKKTKQKVVISKIDEPIMGKYKYNAQLCSDVGSGYEYCGNGKFFETKKEAIKYKNQFKSKK